MRHAAAEIAAALFLAVVAGLIPGCRERTGTTPSATFSPPIGIAFSIPSGDLTFFSLHDCRFSGNSVLDSWSVVGAAINAHGDELIVIDDNATRIGVFSLPELDEISLTSLGGVPVDMQIVPDGSLAYVITHNGNLWLYSVAEEEYDTLETALFPRRIALRPTGNTHAWVACPASLVVDIYDLSDFQPSDTIHCGGQPTAVAFSPDGSTAYVGIHGAPGRIQLYDATSLISLSALEAGTGPFDLALSSDGHKLAAADSSRGQVRIWNLADTTHWDIPVGGAPSRIRYSAAEQSFYVCSLQQSRIYRISVAGDTPELTDSVSTTQWAREYALWESIQ